MATVSIRFANPALQDLSVRSFSVREGMSRPFEVTLTLVSSTLTLDLDQMLGDKVVFELNTATGKRRWYGICCRARFLRAAEDATSLASYALVIVPALWRLGQRQQCRLFQHVSIPTIVRTIADQWDLPQRWHIDAAAYPKLALRTQYHETDLQFMTRLLEEAGISFHLEPRHEDEVMTLVFQDAPHQAEPRETALAFVDEHGLAQRAGSDHVTDLTLVNETRTGMVTLRDYDPRRPRHASFHAVEGARQDERAYEHFGFAPGLALAELDQDRLPAGLNADTPTADELGLARHFQPFGQWRVERLLEAMQADREMVAFDASVPDLPPARVVRIIGHPRPDISADVTMLIIGAELSGKVADQDQWRFHYVAVPARRPYRPPLTVRKPRMFGLQTAVVVGPGTPAAPVADMNDLAEATRRLIDEEIYVDELGRVRVQFSWDREHGYGADSSIWMRVSQGWAGAGYGLFTVPRVGHEVLVAFLGGDPDQPMVVGAVHNAAEPPPFPLPDNKTVSTWRTASSPGGRGFNELRFDDAAGREHVYLQAQKDMDQLTKNDHKMAVGGNTTRYGQGMDTLAVGGGRTKLVNLDESEVTGLNRSTTVGLNRMAQVAGQDTTMVGSRWSVSVARGLSRKLGVEIEQTAKSLGGVMRNAAETVMGVMPNNPLGQAAQSTLADLCDRAAGELDSLISAFSGFTADPGPPPTTIEMVDRRIQLSTGEASITLDGPNVTIAAQGAIALHAMDNISVLSEREVVVAAHDKAALISAADSVIVQAGKDTHLNPYTPGKAPEAVTMTGEAGAPLAEDLGVCPFCEGALEEHDADLHCVDLQAQVDAIEQEAGAEGLAADDDDISASLASVDDIAEGLFDLSVPLMPGEHELSESEEEQEQDG